VKAFKTRDAVHVHGKADFFFSWWLNMNGI